MKKEVENEKAVVVQEVIKGSSWFDISFLLTIIASDLYSIAISIKMNALLYMPAFLIITYFLNDENTIKFVIVVATIPLVQVLIGWRFYYSCLMMIWHVKLDGIISHKLSILDVNSYINGPSIGNSYLNLSSLRYVLVMLC